jgi:hypothetical protein
MLQHVAVSDASIAKQLAHGRGAAAELLEHAVHCIPEVCDSLACSLESLLVQICQLLDGCQTLIQLQHLRHSRLLLIVGPGFRRAFRRAFKGSKHGVSVILLVRWTMACFHCALLPDAVLFVSSPRSINSTERG